ncbi:MAG TPA: hypothetical protein DGG94_03275 [Micromonosporaceae bacterium]|nr:hypothetical protein [Micromonosporaceae bacterium]HCU48836.1 hypothetical protein [Micromonosporaceae bacterium]
MPLGRPDVGASPERTRLAWRRTTLAATAVAVLLGRLAAEKGMLAPAALGALIWVIMLAVVQRRIQALRSPQTRPPGRLLMLTAAACACFGALGVLLVLT